ncbi:hypothetical protein GCM10009734_50900 [Nonomuraea bangladeshensis]
MEYLRRDSDEGRDRRPAKPPLQSTLEVIIAVYSDEFIVRERKSERMLGVDQLELRISPTRPTILPIDKSINTTGKHFALSHQPVGNDNRKLLTRASSRSLKEIKEL